MNNNQENKNFYVTTPIYYVNDNPHIGHMYTSLAADILSRFKKLDGYNTFFLTGTDEHGQKIEKSAKEKNKDIKEFVDTISENFKSLTPLLNLQNDDFIRTTEPRHKEAVQDLWQKLQDNDFIYLDKYQGWYAIRDEAYYTQEDLILNDNGQKVAPTGAEVEWKEEESYFFKLSHFQDKLLQHYNNNPNFIAPKGRFNEVYSFVKRGLKDLSISRSSFSWGIPVPRDNKHVIYVWLDALTNYISALGYPNIHNPNYQNFWTNNSESLHIVGKDIIIFHCVYWPALLMAAGLPLPKKIFAHGWWLNNGQKISKSLGNVITPQKIISTYGLDSIRYFLFKEVNFGNDGNFSDEEIIKRINNELANEYGNLVQRTLSIINKNFLGQLQVTKYSAEQMNYLEKTNNILENCKNHINMQNILAYINEAWEIIKYGNAYIDKSAPWNLIKTNKEEAANILLFIVELLKRASILLNPVMPNATENILQQINFPKNKINFCEYKNLLPLTHNINQNSIVFNKFIG